MKTYKYNAFTLVELIVVISILSVLSTIAFISFQGYVINSRDSVRLSDLANIDRSMNIFISSAKILPYPDDYIEITASGTILNYQGNAGKQVLGKIGVSNGGVDPLENEYYTYVTNEKRNKYQLLLFLENGDSVSKLNGKYDLFASYENRFPKSKGEELGILLSSINNEPAHLNETGIDITNTSNDYKIIMNNNSIFNSGGNKAILNIIPNASCKRIKYFNSFSKDGYYNINPTGLNEIEVFCFMSAKSGPWTKVVDYNGNQLNKNEINNSDWYLDQNNYSYLYSMKDILNTDGKYEFVLEAYKGEYNKNIHFTQDNSYIQNPVGNNFRKISGEINELYHSNTNRYGLSLGSFGNSNMQNVCSLALSYGSNTSTNRYSCVIDNSPGWGTGPLDTDITTTDHIIIWQK